jgi:hypothetical protein
MMDGPELCIHESECEERSVEGDEVEVRGSVTGKGGSSGDEVDGDHSRMKVNKKDAKQGERGGS